MSDLSIPKSIESPLPLGHPRTLGPLGEVGPLSLGCWRMTGNDRENSALVATAVDLGMTLIDNADVYGLDWGGTHFGQCEEALGRVFAAAPGLRERVVLATKGGIIPGVPYNSDPAYLERAVEASLARMGVDHVDLYQVHRPDTVTHPADVAAAFASLHARGLVRAFGVSNHTPHQTRALLAHVRVPVVSTQPEFSVTHLDPMRDGTLDLCMETGLVPLAWSPLAGGRLATGDGLRPEVLSILDEIAGREGTTRAAIAVAFVLAHPSAPVAIVGTQQPARLTELARAAHVTLTRRDLYRLVVASDGVPLP